MMNLGKMMGDAEAMKRFGNTVVVWDLHTRKPKKMLDVPGAPLEIRCAWGANHNYCFTSTALTSKIWLIYEDDEGEWQAKAVGRHRRRRARSRCRSTSRSPPTTRLWVDTWNDGKTRLFDISDPHPPKQIYEEKIGEQLNMVSQSWDGKRRLLHSSLLANWDKKGADNEQFFKAFLGREAAHRGSRSTFQGERDARTYAFRRVFVVRAQTG